MVDEGSEVKLGGPAKTVMVVRALLLQPVNELMNVYVMLFTPARYELGVKMVWFTPLTE
jgi:hypothetical protein